jgi:hypothetical protein
MFNRFRTRNAYAAFLQSAKWLAIRAKKLAVNPTCEYKDHDGRICGSRHNPNCHHVTYPVRWEDTQTHHLMTVCRTHHAKIHGKAI